MCLGSQGDSLLRTYSVRHPHFTRSKQTTSGKRLAHSNDNNTGEKLSEFANYFRRFVKQFADLTKPLDELAGKNTRFQWNDERQNAFEGLKQALLEAPVLHLADVSRPVQFYTDASDLSIAAVLLQAKEGESHPVAYASRKLTTAEKNYTIAERETLAVVLALKCWRLYLFKHFDIYTDNQPVVYLRTKAHLSKREVRWSEFMAAESSILLSIISLVDLIQQMACQDKIFLWYNSIA